jgi:hypothetical protein
MTPSAKDVERLAKLLWTRFKTLKHVKFEDLEPFSEGYIQVTRVARFILKREEKMREALEGLIEALGPCEQFDHHSYCQSHFVESPCRLKKARKAIGRG